MPPRTAYSPASRTVETREKPLISSQRIDPVHPSTLPGAAENACSPIAPAAARAAARR